MTDQDNPPWIRRTLAKVVSNYTNGNTTMVILPTLEKNGHKSDWSPSEGYPLAFDKPHWSGYSWCCNNFRCTCDPCIDDVSKFCDPCYAINTYRRYHSWCHLIAGLFIKKQQNSNSLSTHKNLPNQIHSIINALQHGRNYPWMQWSINAIESDDTIITSSIKNTRLC